MERRKFIGTGVIGSLILGGGVLTGFETMKDKKQAGKLYEEARNIPIIGKYDVIVCGGGPAGVTAAIKAGRMGAKTLLVEVRGCLGGVWTAGLLTWILDHANKSGFMREIEERLRKMGAVSPIDTGKTLAFDAEKMKLLLEELCIEAGVDVLLHTRVVGAKKEGKRLTHIVTESKSFREAWQGEVFIDTTGDGDLAALCGCGFDFGNDVDKSFQPMTLHMVVTGIKFNEIEKFVRWSGDINSASKKRLLQEMKRAGITPSYTLPSIAPIDHDLFLIGANHEYEFSALNSRHITKATMQARQELHKIVNGLKSLGEPWKDLRIVATAEQIGVREGRRIHGLYTVTQEDLVNGKRHPDGVCLVTFGVDVHSPKKADELMGKGYDLGVKSKPYDIPLRALIAKDVDGLMMAGRCISGDFIAHSSYRVTGNSVPMGEAAGLVAAQAASANKLPKDIVWQK